MKILTNYNMGFDIPNRATPFWGDTIKIIWLPCLLQERTEGLQLRVYAEPLVRRYQCQPIKRHHVFITKASTILSESGSLVLLIVYFSI